MHSTTAVPFASALLAVALATAACSSGVDHVSGAAGPIGGSSAPVPATSSPASAQPSVSATPARPAEPPATSAPAARTVLGPTGFKQLKLGMTKAQALATGLLEPRDSGGASTEKCLPSYRFKGTSGDSGIVWYSKKLGIAVIGAYDGVTTPEGIRIGSSEAAMFRAYPKWRNPAEELPHADGHGHVAVPGNNAAIYRIAKNNGKVDELALQFNHQDCYE